MGTIRVILAEDHAGTRIGLMGILKRAREIEVVAEARTGLEALQFCHQFSPDVLVLDIKMPLLNGIEVVEKLKDARSQVKILVLSMYLDKDQILEFLNAGVCGYLAKDEAVELLAPAIQSVRKGERWLSPLVRSQISEGGIEDLGLAGLD
jgi:two-component system invasion response regulator UvrY